MKKNRIAVIMNDTARFVTSVEDKLSIATIILFCYAKGTVMFSELLYCDDKEAFIKKLNRKYKDYEIDLSVNFNRQNVKKALLDTIEKVKEKEDKDGFHKAVFEKDPFALACVEMSDKFYNKVKK